MISRIKGTYDLLDMTTYNWLLDALKVHLIKYNFQEVMTPLIEPLELFQRSLGAQTDVVSKEMYLVTTEHATADSEKLCLRPELTASMMRAAVNAGLQHMPLKWFMHGPAFRHERPQKGRYRQFHQTSIEVIGSDSIAQDALFIAMLENFFAQKLHLTGYALLLNYLGTREDRAAHREALQKFMQNHVAQVCQTCQKRMHSNLLRIFDCKNESCQTLYKKAPVLVDYLSADSRAEWDLLQALLHELGVSYSVQPTLVRGLDYYNKTVFEFVSVLPAQDGALGAQSTFCGGGRYDSLATELGASNDYPSIGAGIGMERLLALVEFARNPLARSEGAALHAVIVPLTVAQQPLALQLVQLLHDNNLHADVLLEGASLKSMLKNVNRLGARYAVLIGEDEQAQGVVSLKQMSTGLEQKVPQRDLVEHIK